MSDSMERLRPLPQFGDDALERIQVRIGEVRVAGGESMLFTIGLGSCVAVALYDAEKRLGGLIHSLLPEPASGRTGAPAGRFTTTAIGELVDRLQEAGASRRRLRARLAGGASMFRDLLEGEGLRLGRRNVEAARDTLDGLGIPIDGEDVLGAYGRSVFFRTTDGRVLVTSVKHGSVHL